MDVADNHDLSCMLKILFRSHTQARCGPVGKAAAVWEEKLPLPLEIANGTGPAVGKSLLAHGLEKVLQMGLLKAAHTASHWAFSTYSLPPPAIPALVSATPLAEGSDLCKRSLKPLASSQ
jgi:hypothetical protein